MKKPTYFAFETSLSAQEVLPLLQHEIKAYNSLHEDWLLYHVPTGSHNRFRIGVERAGHSGGYWYCATIVETAQGSRIAGSIVLNPDENDAETKLPQPSFRYRLRDAIVWILFGIPVLLIVAVVYLYHAISRLFRRHPLQKQSKEERLLDFMTNHLSCHLTEQR